MRRLCHSHFTPAISSTRPLARRAQAPLPQALEQISKQHIYGHIQIKADFTVPAQPALGGELRYIATGYKQPVVCVDFQVGAPPHITTGMDRILAAAILRSQAPADLPLASEIQHALFLEETYTAFSNQSGRRCFHPHSGNTAIPFPRETLHPQSSPLANEITPGFFGMCEYGVSIQTHLRCRPINEGLVLTLEDQAAKSGMMAHLLPTMDAEASVAQVFDFARTTNSYFGFDLCCARLLGVAFPDTLRLFSATFAAVLKLGINVVETDLADPPPTYRTLARSIVMPNRCFVLDVEHGYFFDGTSPPIVPSTPPENADPRALVYNRHALGVIHP